MKNDYMIHAMAAKDEIRAYAITARDTVEEARADHDTSPVVTAALGRMLMGVAMMGMMMQDDRDLITLQVRGDGPMQGITVTGDNGGRVKGFPLVCDVEVEPKYPGKLDVGAALGHGFLRVMRDTGAPEPYVGTVDLVTGEIAEDLTYYFAQSEQTPSAVGLGVLVDTDCSVSCAGGFIVQLLPGASDETITALEENIKSISSVTKMLSDGMTPEDMLGEVLKGFDIKFLEESPVEFYCDCSKQRIEKSLISLPKNDIQEMIDEGKPVEVRCQFCNKTYDFSISELEALM
ncbi:MAG: Hsp33 family molecular chaperone HslO [Lachnospiraceae bacterium]|nr:Hsp33 family molecular chaperone HslO [Lachnospiraceae bacterium]